MSDTVHEIESSSSSQDSNSTFSCGNSSICSQQTAPGSQLQVRHKHSLSLKKKHKENGDQSGFIEKKARQSLFSSIEIPHTDSSTSIKNHIECDSSGQSIGNKTSYRPKVTDHYDNRSRNKESKDRGIFDVFEFSSSQESHCSSDISSQHKVAGNRSVEHEQHLLSLEKRQKEKKGKTEQHEETSRGKRVRKSLFASLNMSSSSSSNDVNIAAESVWCNSQNHRRDSASNVRNAKRLTLVTPLQLTGGEKEELCSSSPHDAFDNTSKNIFVHFSHEKKTLTDNHNVTTAKLQNQTKKNKFPAKVVNEASERKSPVNAIVIDDSPDRHARVEQNTMHLEAKQSTLETVGAYSNLMHQHRTLSKHGAEKQENIFRDFLSQEDGGSQKDASHRKASGSGTFSVTLLKQLKQNSPALAKLISATISSAKRNPCKQLTQDTVIISSDEEADGGNEGKRVQTCHSSESGSNKKTLGLKRRASSSLFHKPHSSTDVTQNLKRTADSLGSNGSCHSSVLNTFPALNDSFSSSSLSEEIPDQGESVQQMHDQNNADRASRSPIFVTMSPRTSIRSMPSLQRKPSSIYRNDSFEENSPPLLSQYPIASPTSLNPHEENSLADSPLPITNDVNVKKINNSSVCTDKSVGEDVTTSESSMFTECSPPLIENPEDNLNGKVTDILDMLDTSDDDFIFEQHSVRKTQPGSSAESKIGPLVQPCEMKSPKTPHISSSSKSSRHSHTETDFKVAKNSNSAKRDKAISHPYSEPDKELYICDSDDVFFMSQFFKDTHFSNEGENTSDVNGQVLAASNFDDRTASKHRNEYKQPSLKHMSGSRSRELADLTVIEKDKDQNGMVTEQIPQISSVYPDKQHCELEPSADLTVAVAVSPGGRSLNSNVDLAVVKENIDDDQAVTGAADTSIYSEINEAYILDSDDDEFFMSQSVLGDSCADKLVDEGRSQNPDEGLAVVKEELDDQAFSGAADASMYSEINDEVYILDSDDDEFFISQSVMGNYFVDKQEDGQNCAKTEKRSEMHEKDSHDLFEDELDDNVTYSKHLSGNDKNFVTDLSGAIKHDGVDGLMEIDNDESDSDDIDYLDMEATPLAPLLQEAWDFSENINSGCENIPGAGKNENDLKNEPYEVNTCDMAKSTIYDDDDDCFLSQIDDFDDAYFAHTQIDYTTHSDEECEDAGAEAKCKEDHDVAMKGSSSDRSSPVICHRRDRSLENSQCVDNITESAESSRESLDMQDPFAVETQICDSSVTNDQNQYDVETLPVSISVDEDTQFEVNEIHTTLKTITKQNLYDKRTTIVSKTTDQNLHEDEELAVSSLLNLDTQDPFSLETQQNSEMLMEKKHPLEQEELSVSPRPLMESVFTTETQRCFQTDTHAQHLYDHKTLSGSPSGSEDSECLFPLQQTQIHTEPKVNDNNKNGTETIVDSSSIKEAKRNLPGTETMDIFKLAGNDPFKSGSHTSCDLLNDDDTQDQFGNSASDNDHLVSVDDDAYGRQTQAFSPGKECLSSYNIATQKNIHSEANDDDNAAMALLNGDDTQDQYGISTPDNDNLLLSEEDDAYGGQTQKCSPGKELQSSYNIATQKNVQLEANDHHTAVTLLNEDDTHDRCGISTADNDYLLSEDDDDYGGQTQAFSPGKECQSSYNLATQKNVQSEANDNQCSINMPDNDHLLSEDDDDYGGQTQAFSPERECQSSYNLPTQKNVQSEANDDMALLNDNTQDQCGIGTSDNENLLLSEEDDAYGGQTQAFSPAKELQSSYNVETQKNGQSEENDDQCSTSIQDNNLLLSEDDDAYGGQTQAFSPGKELQSSYNVETQKNGQSEENDQCSTSIQDNNLLLSEDDDAYGGQTQAFSPGKELQSSYNVETQKNGQSEENDQCSTSIQDNLLLSEDDDAYGGQTQAFSPGKELQSSYNVATQKNGRSESNDDHLFDIQTLADSTLLNDITQDDETQEQPQLTSNDKYLYERQTLANTQQEEPESVYNMVTQKQFQSEDDQGLYDRETCPVLISVDDITQNQPNNETKKNKQAVLEDRYVYERETLASSPSKEIDDLYMIPTQNNFQPDGNDHSLSAKETSKASLDKEMPTASLDKEGPTASLDEDTQDPCDSETQDFHVASEDRYPREREMLAACQDEDSENLYKATQTICQPERNSPNPYNRETLALSPSLGANLTCLLTAEKYEGSKSKYRCPTVGEKLSSSTTENTQDPFDVETDVSSLEDQNGETIAASPSSSRNTESNLLMQMKTGVSPVREYNVSNRETTAVSACLQGDESSNDSEGFFIMKTQKDSSPLATDQDPYNVQTQAVSSSFNEDTHGPFSVETIIDSPSGPHIVSPRDRKTLDFSMLSENSQDPYSMETEVDTSSFEECGSECKETAVASFCNKEVENNYVIETQIDIPLVQALTPCEQIVDANRSVIGSGSRERQLLCPLETKVKSNSLLPAQDNSLQYTEDQIHNNVKSLTPEPFGDSSLPNKDMQYNVKECINRSQEHSTVHHVQINVKNSDNHIVNRTIQSLQKNKSSCASLIKTLSLNISHRVHKPSQEFQDDGNSIEQDIQSPYFVKHKQNSPTVKDADISGSCSSSPARGPLKSSIEHRQSSLLSEPHDLSPQLCQEDRTADKISIPSESSSPLEVKKHSTSFQPDDYKFKERIQKKLPVTDACDIREVNHKHIPRNNGEKNLFSGIEETVCISDAKELSAHDSCMIPGTSFSNHPVQQDLVDQHHKEKTVGLSENHLASIKRPAEHSNETSSKRKCMTKHEHFDTGVFYGTAGRKRSKENKKHNITLPDSKRIKIISAEKRSSELSWITATKGESSGAKHRKSGTVAKSTSKFKRSRRKAGETTEGRLTSQVEAAKQSLHNRNLESRSARTVHEEKAENFVIDDDNDDVAMPSTQDMMNLGLPILSAKLPVSKKHLASGLPSQGRLASEDKELQDKSKHATSGNLLDKGVCNRKNSIQNDVLPPVPLFRSLPADKNVSSSVAVAGLPAHSAVTLKTPACSTESTESLHGQSLVMSSYRTVSRSEPDKLITQTHTTVGLPVSSSSETSAAKPVPTSSAKLTYAKPAVSFQSEVSVDRSSLAYSVPALASETVHLSGPSLPTLQGVPKQTADAKSSYQGILKGSKPSELNQYGNKAVSKVTFKEPHYESHSLQRRGVTLPQAAVSQLQEPPKSKPEAKLYFLSTLLQWNPVWLQEKEKIKSLPELFVKKKVEEACCQLRMYYSKFHEYVDITLNLLILECWETIYKDWKMQNVRAAVKLEVHCTRPMWQPHKEKEGQSLIYIEVTGIVTQQNRSSIPSVGDLLILDFWGAKRLEKKHDEPFWYKQFALVKHVGFLNDDIRQFMQTYKIFETSSAWKDRNPVMVKLTLVLKHKGVIIIPTKLHKIQDISSLKIIERQIDALVNLPESPLCAQLLKPTPGMMFAYTRVQPDAGLLSKLNEEQACSVATIVKEVVGSPTSQKMFLLQGPPGTGKSHTILALIHQILIKTSFKCRICMAAPSNAAVDEMAKRIISFSHKLKSAGLSGISLVRVGNKNKVHTTVNPFMLDNLVEQVLNRDIPESLRSELRSLEKEALELERALSDKSLTEEQKVMRIRKQGEVQKKIFKLKADMAPQKKNGRERYNARCRVLDKAQVICGTLNSLGSEDLKEIVLRSEENCHKRLPFTCLIIDEATQAIEVECLIPLQYRMTKVVLVGDPEQLPATVLSQMASEKQLARSLFERMEFCVKEFIQTSKSPVMMLTRQYRMHNEILYLPNSFFYDRQLVTDKSVLDRRELIAPYLVFDIQESKESRDANTRSVSNEEEAICIAQLCEIVTKKIDKIGVICPYKIGVICPYLDQRQSILTCLRQRNLNVEVNTVDSFQGQERDVIILSCVRAQSTPSGIGFLSDRKRMNVALTRARQALYVIGHFDTLKTDELWEQLYRNAVERKLLVKVPKTSGFEVLAKNAVCRQNNYIANGS